MRLKKRLISMVLMVTLIPMILIVISMGIGIGTLQVEFFQKIANINNNTVNTTNSALTSLGEDIIQQKAEDVTRQMDIYLAAYPEKTVADLQRDNFFQSIAVQTVGKTGYTTVMDANRLVNLFHKNPKNVGTDYHNQSKTNTEFYNILSSGAGDVDTFGYYNWPDADGSVKPKYAYYSCCKQKTADGVTLRVGATTYIDEFSLPSEEVRTSITRDMLEFEKSVKDSLLLYAILISIIIIISSLISIIIGIRFSERITTPIQHLSDGVQNIVEGRLAYRIGDIGGDELGVLARSFDDMAQSLENHNTELQLTLAKQKRTNQEIINLTHEVELGILTHKISTKEFDGEFRIMVDGINTMLDVIMIPLSEAIRVAGEFSHAKFSTRFNEDVAAKGDFVALKTGLNTIGEELSTVLTDVSKQVNTLTISSETATASVEEINAEVLSLAENSVLVHKNAEQSASSVEQILIAMEELTTSVSTVATKVDSVSRLSQDANGNSIRGVAQAGSAEEGIRAINGAVTVVGITINEIREQMDDIGKIVGIISGIAEQTNLLALNAAIEAARVGEAGLGFAVVANEVKTLARESQGSAEDIAKIISSLKKQSEKAAESMNLATAEVSKGSGAITDTIQFFHTIAKQVEEISRHMIEVASLSEEEAAAVQEIAASVSEVKQISDNTASMAVKSTFATDEAAIAGEKLKTVIRELSVIASRIDESMSRLNQ